MAKFAVQLPQKPTVPKNWSDVKKDPHKEFWYNSVLECYTKNYQVGLWSMPISRDKIPQDVNILPSVSTSKIKNTEVDIIYNFYFRLCANGLKMRQGIDYNKAHSLTGFYESIQIMLALSAGLGMTV